MMEAVASILAVGGLAFITFGVYRGAPALKQKSSPAANAALVFIPFGLGYWIGGIILLALELQ